MIQRGKRGGIKICSVIQLFYTDIKLKQTGKHGKDTKKKDTLFVHGEGAVLS